MTYPKHLKGILVEEKLEKEFDSSMFANIQDRLTQELFIGIQKNQELNKPMIEQMMNIAKKKLDELKTTKWKIENSITKWKKRIQKYEAKVDEIEVDEIKKEVAFLYENNIEINDMIKEISFDIKELKENKEKLHNKTHIENLKSKRKDFIRLSKSYSPL